jgi:hypothetical protein
VSDGRNDLMCCAQTGSGKTCGFLLPVVARLSASEAGLSLTPGGVSDWLHMRPELDLWVALTPGGCQNGVPWTPKLAVIN